MKRYLVLLVFILGFVLVFSLCTKDAVNIESVVSNKQNNDEIQSIYEDCYYVYGEDGKLMLMHLCREEDALKIDIEPSYECVSESEIPDVLIISDKVEKLDEGVCLMKTDRKRWDFNATLGDICQNRDVPGGNIFILCECQAPKGACVQVTTVSNGVTSVTCSSSIEKPCRSDYTLNQCVEKVVHPTKNYESNGTVATRIIIDSDKFFYNGIMYE